jgi:hypothetical protein
MKTEPFLPKALTQPVQLLVETEHAIRSTYSISIAKLEAAEKMCWFASAALGFTSYLYLHSYLVSSLVALTCVIASTIGYRKAIAATRAMCDEAITLST